MSDAPPLDFWVCVLNWSDTPGEFNRISRVCKASRREARTIRDTLAARWNTLQKRPWGWLHDLASTKKTLLHGSRGVYQPQTNQFVVSYFKFGSKLARVDRIPPHPRQEEGYGLSFDIISHMRLMMRSDVFVNNTQWQPRLSPSANEQVNDSDDNHSERSTAKPP